MPFKTYLINKIINKKFRLNGIVPSNRLPHKHRLRQSFGQHVLYSPDQLPPKADLRPEMSPVEDQSQIGSCTANSLAGAYEYLTMKDNNGYNTDVSRLFIYYNARVKGNNSTSVTDSGCSMTDAIEALEEFGTCPESVWPYDISNVNQRPNDQAYQQAAEHKISEALQINVDLNEMKSCLAQGFPIAFGLKLFSSFDKAAQTGIVPMPNSGDGNRQSDGSHAMLVVGYSDQSNAFIVRNSWGANWGDKGYCYIPYDYMTDTDLCFDMWTVRKVANDNFGQGHWNFDDAVNLLHRHHHRGYQSDDDNDDNHTIEGFNENDDNNYGYGGDNDYGRGNDDYSDRYQNDQRNDNAYYDDQNQSDPYQDNNYNSGGDFSNQNYDQYSDDRNNYDDYSRYN